MNLIIDIGNSLSKIAIFDKGEIVQITSSDKLNIAQLNGLKLKYPGLDSAILSSVVDVDAGLLKFMKSGYRCFIEFDQDTNVPLENFYESKETLGPDRIAAAVGGVTLFPWKDLLVIDAGTAVTYDLIDKNNRFLGGNISPGLNMRFKALNEFARKLPIVNCADRWTKIGKTTEEAIRAGVQNGMIFEMDGTIDHVLKEWPDCQVILTGGDSFFFDKKLKNTIFVKFEITLIGLNRILEYNAEKN